MERYGVRNTKTRSSVKCKRNAVLQPHIGHRRLSTIRSNEWQTVKQKRNVTVLYFLTASPNSTTPSKGIQILKKKDLFYQSGFPDTIDTYGLISGLWTSVFALGAFVGPTVAGILFDAVGFPYATMFIIGSQVKFFSLAAT